MSTSIAYIDRKLGKGPAGHRIGAVDIKSVFLFQLIILSSSCEEKLCVTHFLLPTLIASSLHAWLTLRTMSSKLIIVCFTSSARTTLEFNAASLSLGRIGGARPHARGRAGSHTRTIHLGADNWRRGGAEPTTSNPELPTTGKL
jgi:hypothetical protein